MMIVRDGNRAFEMGGISRDRRAATYTAESWTADVQQLQSSRKHVVQLLLNLPQLVGPPERANVTG